MKVAVEPERDRAVRPDDPFAGDRPAGQTLKDFDDEDIGRFDGDRQIEERPLVGRRVVGDGDGGSGLTSISRSGRAGRSRLAGPSVVAREVRLGSALGGSWAYVGGEAMATRDARTIRSLNLHENFIGGSGLRQFVGESIRARLRPGEVPGKRIHGAGVTSDQWDLPMGRPAVEGQTPARVKWRLPTVVESVSGHYPAGNGGFRSDG